MSIVRTTDAGVQPSCISNAEKRERERAEMDVQTDAGWSSGLWRSAWIAVAICTSLLLLGQSTKFKYYGKLALLYAIVISSAGAMFFYAIWRPGEVENHWPLTVLIPWCSKHLFGLDVEIRNKKTLQTKSPLIIMVNHQSVVDIFVMMFAWPYRCTSLAKKELFYLWPFGISAWLCGTVFIDRLNHEQARGTLNRTAEIIKKRNIKILIYPEGTRNSGTEFMPFKKGGFHLAVQAQIPVVPMVFSSYRTFYSTKEKKFEQGKVIISILDPVDTVGLTASDVTQLTESVRSKMIECYEQTSKELDVQS